MGYTRRKILKTMSGRWGRNSPPEERNIRKSSCVCPRRTFRFTTTHLQQNPKKITAERHKRVLGWSKTKMKGEKESPTRSTKTGPTPSQKKRLAEKNRTTKMHIYH